MTIEQQRLEDIAYTETRVREEMQQYIISANKRADDAEHANIANIIGMCRNFNCSDEQTIKQLMERAHLTYDEASEALTEY